MSRVYKSGSVPPGGWKYDQPGLPTPVTGGNYQELITNITNARIHNQIKLGNVEREFEEWFCKTHPNLCDANSPPIQPEAETDDPTKVLRERVASFAGNRYQYAGSISLESSDVANKRASVCESCTSKASYQDGCPCLEQIKRTLVLLTQNQKTEPDLSGFACSVAGHDLNAGCWLTEPFLRHRRKYLEQLPDHCWMKAL